MLLGPLLTLVVFKPGKKSLKFDLVVIAALQLAALLYGAHTVFIGRPAFVVFVKDRFEIARPTELDQASLDTALRNQNAAARESLLMPQWIGTVESVNPERRNEILMNAVSGGPDWQHLPELYVPLAQVQADIIARAKPLNDLKAFNPTAQAALDAITKKFGPETRWHPLKAPSSDMTVLIHPKTGAVLSVVDLRPWAN